MVRKLGANHYIDSNSVNASEELLKYGREGVGGCSSGDGSSGGSRGGAKVILATVPSAKAMSSVLGGLAVNGKLVVIGASDAPLLVPPLLLLFGRRSIIGWPSGSSRDSQDTLSFSVLSGIRSVNEVFPKECSSDAYNPMITGKARFRAVLTTT